MPSSVTKVPNKGLYSCYDILTKHKEVHPMNMMHSTAKRPVSAPRYPNAADRSYFVNKAADILLCTASTMGIVVAFFFILTI